MSYISLPDPQAAPYGQAAIAWLRQQDWSDAVEHKLVYTPSAVGVVNHLQQEVAEIGITSYSLASQHFEGDQYRLSNASEMGISLPKHYLLAINDLGPTRKMRIFLKDYFTPGNDRIEELGFKQK